MGPLLETMVSAADDAMMRRQQMLQFLKVNLHKAQEKIKLFADKRRSERVFQVGDMIYLKLQLYRQSSIAVRKNLKLCSKYFGPYQAINRVGQIAYKLQLPSTSKIHPKFHVSLLKKKLSTHVVVQTNLPITNEEGQMLVQPTTIL